ncbi:helix-turn-helix transcriptional regulator [Nonomuraea basaltis]|uniref:helix-turn-helix transcriptional regulator n=1 Tax=Nonomuraea basaltis TaxID=2495887 RepID=UPI00110C6A20|nr:LuxR C-terminal-related transcriptional regulator [Nonomuraea basaltis]TMR90108.1 helix-turn-helix transcriptional regulator [Nonomuraea basaltis]
MDDSTDDGVAQALYARMHSRGESLPEAAQSLGLTVEEIERARDQLTRLNLLNPGTQTAVNVAAALARTLQRSHRALDRLVEQHVRTAALAQHYLDLPRQAGGDAHVEFFPRADRARLNQRIDELAELSSHEVLGLQPPANWTRETLEAGLARTKVTLGNGVRVRALYAQISLSNPLIREYVGHWRQHGVEVRVAPVIPTRLLIYDRHTAIVQADPDDLEAGAVLISGASVVSSIAAIYDYCWMTASEPEDVPGSPDGSDLTDQQRAVLRLLATGAKDSAIARSLGVSTRTITRLVSELTAALGASSRFQAGVRAARLGWLD